MGLALKKVEVTPAGVGRPPLGVKPTLVRLSPEAVARIEALVGPQRRAEFIREAVERELERRERMEARKGRDA